MLAAHLFWIFTILSIGAWWGVHMHGQAKKIAALETRAGIDPAAVNDHFFRTQRMIGWESAAFFVLLMASTALLVWIYWRDMKRNRSMHAFFASVTHELKTPLTSIRLQAESIAEGFAGTDGGRRNILVSRLLEDTMRLESQVERTLELGRIEGGGKLHVRPVRIKPIIERAMNAWRDMPSRRMDVRADIPDITVLADIPGFQVVLKNLFENTLRHTHVEPVRISISLAPEDRPDRKVLCFRDNGEGYPGDPKELGRLFLRGSGSQGAGVGLYLAGRLMSAMGGGIGFSSDKSGFEARLEFLNGDNADG